MLKSRNLRAQGLEVISLRARRESSDYHVAWSVDYAPEPEPDENGRVVFATLHAFDENGGGDVTVAALVEYPQKYQPTSQEFEDALRGSDAVEALYDLSRTVLRGVAATVASFPQLDRQSPDAEFGLLQRAPAPETGTEEA